jgi:transcriptional antiterminator RfaH
LASVDLLGWDNRVLSMSDLPTRIFPQAGVGMSKSIHLVESVAKSTPAGAGDGTTARWFAVQSKSGQELLALKNLMRQGYPAYCPIFVKHVKHARQVVKRHKPFFPGYIFVQIDPDRDNWFPINSTIGVARMLTFGGRLAQLPLGFVERMRELSLEQGAIAVPQEFRAGDRVRVLSNSFDNWIGEVTGQPDADRVTLLVDMLSRKVPLTVDRGQLVRAS